MFKTAIASAALSFMACVPAQSTTTVVTRAELPAQAWPAPERSMLLGAARAGARIVAVGEHGIVLLSDDEGKRFRQAKRVPVAATLTAVTFVDASHGWVVGQWGVILATTDGGETWTRQRMDVSADRPLFSVAFTNEREGMAVGLWSMLLRTRDGGRTWTQTSLPKPPGGGKADRNLYHVFNDAQGSTYISAEQGTVLKSMDHGESWTYHETGGKGSLWSGIALADGRIIVGGLLGSLFQSSDGGATWSTVDSGTKSSITELVAARDGLRGIGLNGMELRQAAAGAPVQVAQRQDRANLTAVVFGPGGKPVLFSQDGLLATP